MSLLFFKVFLNNLYFVNFSLAQKKINAKIYFDKFRFEKLISLRNREKNAAQKIKKVKFALSAKSSFPLWKFENSFYVCKNFCMKKHNYIVERHAQAIAEKIKKEVEYISEHTIFDFLSKNQNFYISVDQSMSEKEAQQIKMQVCKLVVRKLLKKQD